MPSIESKINAELDGLKSQLKSNIAQEQARGAKIESLETRTLAMQSSSIQFGKQATRVKDKMWWECVKWYAIGGGVIFLFFLFIYIVI